MRSYLLIILTIAFVSCKSENNSSAQSTLFSGEPYTGTVKVKIEPPQANSTTYTGRGSLHFVDNGDIVRLILSGVISNGDTEAGDAGFILDGAINQSAWSFKYQDMQFAISKNGQVSGSNTTPREKYLFNGTLSPTKFNMEVVVDMLDETDGGYPAGTIFRYNYSFVRSDPKNEQPSSNGACKNIRWEMRNIWSPGGNGMIMVRVPVCND